VSCAEAEGAVRWAETLAARALTGSQRDRLMLELRARATTAPDEVRAALAAAGQADASLATLPPLAQAERRSTLVWELGHEGGAFPVDRFPDVVDVARTAAAVWASDDAERLALSEMDIEGWLRYCSLAREVQGGGVLRLSVADRVTAYHVVRDRWKEADRAGKVALTAVGPFWSDVRARWAAASYEEQQAWIRAAPLPPPMTATSIGYVEALTEGDVVAHVRALHERLGPLRLGVLR
jgi:hypothetical protein